MADHRPIAARLGHSLDVNVFIGCSCYVSTLSNRRGICLGVVGVQSVEPEAQAQTRLAPATAARVGHRASPTPLSIRRSPSLIQNDSRQPYDAPVSRFGLPAWAAEGRRRLRASGSPQPRQPPPGVYARPQGVPPRLAASAPGPGRWVGPRLPKAGKPVARPRRG